MWEPLWQASPPRSPRRHLLHGLLLLTAALLRWEAGRTAAASRLASRALEELAVAKKRRSQLGGLTASRAYSALQHLFCRIGDSGQIAREAMRIPRLL